MVKQFLLNPDGTVPGNVNVALLEAEGIPLVLPTPRWAPQPGFTLEERDPERGKDGLWRQVWAEVPVEEAPEVDNTVPGA